MIFQVGQILGERKTGKRGLEFLVRWKGFGKSEDSWEKSTALKDAKVAIQEFRQATVSIGLVRPNKKLSVFGETGPKILGRVGTFFFRKNNLMHFERHFAFQNA